MLTDLHLLLTYTCNFECDHCFLYCSPRSLGTFSISQVESVLQEGQKIGTIKWIFYEGGEPFLFFPLLNESIRLASEKGFKVGVVTNAYGAISERDAELWLAPLAESGLSFLNISNDTFHYGEVSKNPALIAISIADKLGIETSPICIEPPKIHPDKTKKEGKGRPVVGGDVRFRGRAVDKLAGNLPVRPLEMLSECPDEDLVNPSRVHLDPLGNVHICQGISLGNMWTTSLSEIVSTYDSETHPICGPLVRGGPVELARALGFEPAAGYVDECHLCYLARKASIDKHPEYILPKQVYGIE